MIPRASVLAPFRVRSFRFQWPADMATSWAFEMENLILGWYVLVETGSVLLLTVFASLLYIGTLLAPMFGVMADRVGHRNLLCAMRGFYALLAATVMVLAYTDVLTETSTPWAPWYVVPSDHKWVRNLIVSELLTHHLRQLDPKVPAPDPSVAGLRVD